MAASVGSSLVQTSIVSEINNVLAAMRLNSRWSSRARMVNGLNSESPLLKGFKELRKLLESISDITLLDPVEYLKPFLNVIRSEETSGPITGVALSSLDKFLKGSLIMNAPNAAKALEGIADAVTHCRFEATDPDSDEVVLMRILQVLRGCINSPFGMFLPDDMIFEMVQTCFRMSNQLRLSELLRKTAEQTLIEMFHAVFNVDQKISEEGEAKQGPVSYSFSCSFRLFQFICSIINPPSTGESERIDEDICLLGLTLVNTILETSGKSVERNPQILKFIQEELCKRLLRCCQAENLLVLNRSLTVFYNLFITVKKHLKPQLELFFIILTRLMESKTTTYEQQETALEFILDICKQPYFMVELYLNYDSDQQCSNVFENLCKFLYKNAFPASGALYTTHLLSLEGLLAVVQAIANRLPLLPATEFDETALELRRRKREKALLANAAELFNREPAEGIASLKSVNLLPPEDSPVAIAQFLRTAPGLSKAVIGEYMGKKKDFNIAVLEAYVNTFDFKSDAGFIDSIRSFLESFRIPGEAQIIARVLEVFAKAYCNAVPGTFANADAAYILSYSVVMLNVDQHNPEVKNKMTEQEFIRNLRGINDKKDLPPEMLKDIYHSIKRYEMKIPEEQANMDIQNVWRHVLGKARVLGEFKISSSGSYDQDIFSVVWGPLIAAISVVFDTADDEGIVTTAIDGFNLCARISAHYRLCDVLDNLVISLCKFSSLLSLSGPSAIVFFGRNRKAQLATKTVFAIAREHSGCLREGWKNILSCIITLHKLGQLPNVTEKIESFDYADTPPANATPPQQLRGPVAILTSLGLLGGSSWFGGGGSTEPDDDEYAEQDANAEEAAKLCIKHLNIKELFSETKDLQSESLMALIRGLVSCSSRPQKATIHFDEKTAIFCIDLLTNVALLNQNRVELIWSLIADHLVGIVNGATSVSPYVEKATISLLTLCINLLRQREDIAEQLLGSLRLLLKMEPPVAESLCRKITLGIAKLAEKDTLISKSLGGLETLSLFLEFASRYSNSESSGFRVVTTLVNGNPTFTSSNFQLWVDIVCHFTRPKCKSDTALQAMELVFSLYARVAGIVQSLANQAADPTSQNVVNVESSAELEAWNGFWYPTLHAFSVLCKDNRPDVRNYAMTYLQKSLLSSQLGALSPFGWHRCFIQVIFPLLRDLIKPPSSPTGSLTKSEVNSLEEARLRAAALLSKIFLQYLTKIIHLPDFSKLWLEILQFLELYMKADELLGEAVRESLKNILLVMSASGIFQPGVVLSTGEDLWTLSWTAIDPFCPSLKSEFDLIYK